MPLNWANASPLACAPANRAIGAADHAPVYPEDARRMFQTGWVTASFGISQGHTVSAHIERASPPGVFDGAVLKSLAGLEFDPSAQASGCKLLYVFRLDN